MQTLSRKHTHTYIASVILSVIRAVSVNSVVQCKIHLLYNLHFVVVIRGFFVLLPKLNHMKKKHLHVLKHSEYVVSTASPSLDLSLGICTDEDVSHHFNLQTQQAAQCTV